MNTDDQRVFDEWQFPQLLFQKTTACGFVGKGVITARIREFSGDNPAIKDQEWNKGNVEFCSPQTHFEVDPWLPGDNAPPWWNAGVIDKHFSFFTMDFYCCDIRDHENSALAFTFWPFSYRSSECTDPIDPRN
jgi:hypothetical protein